MDAPTFIAEFFGPRSKADVCLTSYANDRAESGKYLPVEIFTRDLPTIDQFLQTYDVPGRAVYFCVNTITGGKRSKQNVAEITGLFCDLDFKSIRQGRKEIEAVLARLPLPTTYIVFSGHGLHCYWLFKSGLKATGALRERVEKALQRLAWLLAGDPHVGEIARVLRLPGSHNSKFGEWAAVKVVHANGSAYKLEQLEEWLQEVPTPLLQSTSTEKKKANGSIVGESNPFQRLAEHQIIHDPMDVEGRLAQMQFQGADDASVHATQRDVTASLISSGADPDEIVAYVLAHTKQLGHGWNWRQEERKIRGLCIGWYLKHLDLLPPQAPDWLRNDARLHGFYQKQVKDAPSDGAMSPKPDNVIPFVGKTSQPQHADDPIDLWLQFPVPELPKGLLPSQIEEFAFEQSEVMGCDPAGLAMGALTVCAALIPDSITLQIKRHDPNWKIATRLWTALIGDVSSMKSPIIRETTRALVRIDTELAKKYARARIAYEEMNKDQKAAAVEPVPERLRIEDATPESVQGILQHNTDGVLLIRDELSAWFGGMEKYAGRGGSGADRGFWLSSYNGGPYTLDRVKRGSHVIENLSVSLLGGIQPSSIRKVAGDIVDDGLIQRLVPITLRKATLPDDDDRPISEVARSYDNLIERMYDLRSNFYGGLQFSDAAQVVRRATFAKNHGLENIELINQKIVGHFGKYNGLFAQLCVLWHCVEHAYEKFSPVIEVDVAQRVATFMHSYLRRHAFSFYCGMLDFSDEYDRLKALASFILAHESNEITCRDAQRGTQSMRDLKRRDVENLFDYLEAFGWVSKVLGRRSNEVKWMVNPAVHRLYKQRAEEERKRLEKIRETLAGIKK